MSHVVRTLAFITSSNCSSVISVIIATLLVPLATTSPSTRPKCSTARATISLASFSVSGRKLTLNDVPPCLATTPSSSKSFSLLAPVMVTLAPSSLRRRAVALPSAPVAPMTTIDWPVKSVEVLVAFVITSSGSFSLFHILVHSIL